MRKGFAVVRGGKQTGGAGFLTPKEPKPKKTPPPKQNPNPNPPQKKKQPKTKKEIRGKHGNLHSGLVTQEGPRREKLSRSESEEPRDRVTVVEDSVRPAEEQGGDFLLASGKGRPKARRCLNSGRGGAKRECRGQE